MERRKNSAEKIMAINEIIFSSLITDSILAKLNTKEFSNKLIFIVRLPRLVCETLI